MPKIRHQSMLYKPFIKKLVKLADFAFRNYILDKR